MKRLYVYIIAVVFEILFAIFYGFFLQNIINLTDYIFLSFCFAFLILLISAKTENNNFKVKAIELLTLSFILCALSLAVFWTGNNARIQMVGEYDVIVEDTTYQNGGIAYFTNKKGHQGQVDLHDYRSITSENEDFIDIGDTIRVQEYAGLFGQTYYVFIAEIK